MRVSYAVCAGVLALACGSSANDLFEGTRDASAGTGGSSGRGGSTGGGSAGKGGIDAASGGSAGTSDDAGGATSDGAVEDVSSVDGALGSGGASDGGGGVGGGVGIGGPGQVVCFDQACDLSFFHCCLGFPIFGCQSKFPPVCIVSAQINCDDALDCENNQTCCASVGTNGRLTGANCQDTCDNGTVVCNDSTRCPTGTTCRPVAGMQNYRTCRQ